MNTSQSTFVSEADASTQNAKILALLEAARGNKEDGWVGLPELGRASGSWAVHSRIADLRKSGHDIRNRTRRAFGKCLSFYRLQPPELIAAEAALGFSLPLPGETAKDQQLSPQ